MLLNYDFLEFENDKKVRVIDDKLCVNISDFFGIGDENDKIFLGDEISNIKDNPTEAYVAEVKIGSAQNLKINQIADDLKQSKVVSNKLIANALITQKATNDTPHDDDLD